MFVDARELGRDARIEADLCIVGAGAAGITLARELLASELSIVVLESGGAGYDQATQALYVGEEGGTFLAPESEYLTATRLRQFGGTTGHWSGWCRPLDPEDFERRAWVEPSGWPIAGHELAPFYERARGVLNLQPFDDRADAAGRPLLLPPTAAFATTFLHVNPLRFAPTHGRRLRRARSVRVLTRANLTEIVVDEAGQRVERLEAATLAGGRFSVRARAYVLATGGIENARLLLASSRVAPRGLGNDHDLVGRCFMEHPLVRVGDLVTSDPAHAKPARDTYSTGVRPGRAGRLRGALRLRPDRQRRHRLLNGLVFLWRARAHEFPKLTREGAGLAAELRGRERPRIACWRVGIASEQLPNPQSRVYLTAERDALGMARAGLDWRLTEQDRDSVRRTAALLAGELGAGLDGRLRLLESPRPWGGWEWSKHHMGTTRMAADPRQGVVDTDCRVHGIANLYVAGSSVFPTSGCSNPTLTLVALALRLAGHLETRLA